MSDKVLGSKNQNATPGILEEPAQTLPLLDIGMLFSSFYLNFSPFFSFSLLLIEYLSDAYIYKGLVSRSL